MINDKTKDLDEMDKKLVDSLEITFMTGKGNNHLVPLIFPPDTIQAIKTLCDPLIRSQVDVNPSSRYVFPSLANSANHVSSWHAVHKMCEAIKDKLQNIKTLTATSNRHRVSTLFAMLDLPNQDREWFYKHMGHSETINQCRYQAPPAIMELTKVAKHLVDMDGGLEIKNDNICSKDTSEDKPGCSKDTSEDNPGCSKDVADLQPQKNSFSRKRKQTSFAIDNNVKQENEEERKKSYKLRGSGAKHTNIGTHIVILTSNRATQAGVMVGVLIMITVIQRENEI